MIPAEEWRPVSGWPGYKVSSHGRVRSPHRGGRVLTPSVNPKSGYSSVGLRSGGKATWGTVHSLVTKTFIGPRPDGLVVRHLDGDPQNNTISNLVYGTHSENARDTVRHGRHHLASRTHCPREHRLALPNLRVKAWRARSARECLACHRADGYCKRHPELDRQEVSDRYYSEIMNGKAHHRLMSNTYTCDYADCSTQISTTRALVYPHLKRRTGWVTRPNLNRDDAGLLHFCPSCAVIVQARDVAVKRVWALAHRGGKSRFGPSRPGPAMNAVVSALAAGAHSQAELTESTGHAQQPVSRCLNHLHALGFAEIDSATRTTAAGRIAKVWTLTPSGRDLANLLLDEQPLLTPGVTL